MMRRNLCTGFAARAFLLVALAVSPAFAAPTHAVPVASTPRFRTLFGRPFFRQTVLSPRAHALAFVVPSRRHRRRLVEVLNLRALLSAGRMSLQESVRLPKGVRVLTLKWLSPHLLLVVTRRPAPAARIDFGLLDDRLRTHAYKALPLFRGSGNGPLARVDVVATLRSGPVFLWRSRPLAEPVLYRYNLAMGRLRPVCHVPLAGAQVLVNARGWPRLADVTGPRGPGPAVLIGRGRCTSWIPVTARFRLEDLRRYDRFLSLGPHGDGVYFLAPSPTLARTLGLYRLGLIHLRRTLLVASPRDDVYESRRGRWTSLVWGRRKRRLVGVDFMPGKPRIYWIHPHDPLVRLLRGLGRELDGEVVRVRGSGPHGRVLLLETLGDRNPGRYYLYVRRPTPSLTFLMARRPALHESDMVPLRPVLIPEGRGKVLHAYLSRSRSAGPLVVLAHGGGFGRRFVWFYDPLIQSLALAGDTVLAVNTHGSGGYGVLYRNAGEGDRDRVVSDDLAAAARWAVRRGLAPAASVAVAGQGVGGDEALLAAARFPSLFHAVVSIDPAIGTASRPPRSHNLRRLLEQDLLRRGKKRPFRTPTLFVRLSGRGGRGATEGLVRRLRQEGRPVELDVVPTGPRTGPRWAVALHAVVRFLAVHLGPPAAASGAARKPL
jgi:pimeloyl-ACP methyl ester carboxylesterase